MKKLILAALAASIAAGPMIAAPAVAAPQDRRGIEERHSTTVRQQPGRTVIVKRTVVRAPQHRNWRKGQRFDRRQARHYQVINNWRGYRGRHLYAPPRGYRWVRSDNDAVLVAISGGLIGAVLAGAFN
ncbi:RcnB family protein [Sphingomonas sp. RT2P30]|uniref:RcnB family protein n=1 Tax=Parasphingomonas halimpatiens TaxID=3096162 RepID=UPI002FC7B752